MSVRFSLDIHLLHVTRPAGMILPAMLSLVYLQFT